MYWVTLYEKGKHISTDTKLFYVGNGYAPYNITGIIDDEIYYDFD